MRFEENEAQERIAAHDHGTLCTVHAKRGVDAVPVVYAAAHGYVTIPIDLVKPKTSARLQRQRNLEDDPRATLLVQHWDPDDWSQLWWARAELHWEAKSDLELTASLYLRRPGIHRIGASSTSGNDIAPNFIVSGKKFLHRPFNLRSTLRRVLDHHDVPLVAVDQCAKPAAIDNLVR